MRRKGVLKNMTMLADALGTSTTFIKRMKYAGFAMPGGVSTESWALKWLKDHPDFRQKDYLRPPIKQPQARLLNGEHQAEKGAGKLHEPYR
jgi:RES domain-containing protein